MEDNYLYRGILIFIICLIGTIGFENDDYIPIVFVIIASICIFLYFLIFMRSKLVFSEEEKDELFKAYLINANLATKAKMKKTRVNQWNNKVNPSGGAGSFQQKKSKEEPSSNLQVRNSLSNSAASVHPPPLTFNGFLEKENAFLQATPTTDPLAQSAASTTTNQASCTSSSTLSQKVVKYFNTKMNSVIPLDQDIVSLPQLSQQEERDHYHPPHHYHQSTPYVEKELHANGKSHPMEEIIDN